MPVEVEALLEAQEAQEAQEVEVLVQQNPLTQEHRLQELQDLQIQVEALEEVITLLV
jgi:hypothetical protein